MYPVPAAAIEPAHAVLQPGSVEQDYFWLNVKYPSSSAVAHYDKIFVGWRRCYSRERQWSSFRDSGSGGDHMIHQLSRSWVNRANDTAVTLLLKYTSSISAHAGPETNRQFVALVRRLKPNAEQNLGEVGISCERDT
jgi:hypothetical protein